MYDIEEIIHDLIERKDMGSEEIPGIYLYMDQVLSLFEENFPYNHGEQKLTKTMINNYAKGGIIQPAYKKKYNKEHILMILVTCMLKRELSLSEIKELVDESVEKVENFDGKNAKKAKTSEKAVDKKEGKTSKELENRQSENDLENGGSVENSSLQDESVKLGIEEIYNRFISRKDTLESIVEGNLDKVIEILKDDNIVGGNNKLLDVLMLCYCSNVLSEAARAIIRGEIDD